MTGHRPFSGLTAQFAPEARARIAARAAELHEGLGLNQEDMAASLDAQQPAVAKLEKRSEMHISNLRRYIEALGGQLEITARFPEANVVIGHLGERPRT